MVNLEAVRASNAGLKNLNPGLVAVFVGGTSGIGEATLQALVRHTISPKIYIVGRKEATAARIADEAKKANQGSTVNFIQSDATLLKNVDQACADIKAKESKLNLLVLSQGFLTLQGRDETAEGLDKKFSLNYYSRMRFTQNLLPLLNAAASESNSISRVVSILNVGREGSLFEDDLELKRNYSLRACEAHTATMTDFSFEELAKQNPTTAFVHTFPGAVKTSMAANMGGVMGRVATVLMPLFGSFLTPAEESGEKHLYAGTAEVFAPRKEAKGDAAVGSDGLKGSGAYLLNQKLDPSGKTDLLKGMRDRGLGPRIWKHTLDVFERICP